MASKQLMALVDGRIGKAAMLLAMEGRAELEHALLQAVSAQGFRAVKGRVGSMDAQKIVAAIEIACRRNELVVDQYREIHALYHAVLEALQGLGRGQLAFGSIHRTVGISFAVLRGPRDPEERGHDDNWLAVAVYGSIGAPVKGWEHEASGLGINHL